MLSEDLIGICDERTTYRDDFRGYQAKKIKSSDSPSREKLRSKKTAPVFAETHDSFQKLDYQSRLPFDALWRPKEIIATDPRTEIVIKCQPEVNENFSSSRTKATEIVSPAVNLDYVKDPETRKRVVNYLYKTTMEQAAQDVWRSFQQNHDKRTAHSAIRDSPDPLPPANFPQNRDAADPKNLTQENFYSLNSAENSKKCENYDERRVIGELLSEKKLRLPYDKLPLSYGGYRTSVALGVPLEKKKLSPYHPDLTVAQTLTSRNC